MQVIKTSNIIIGYTSYITSLGDLIADKEVHSFPMLKEQERCNTAIDLALKGNIVSIVSSGDPGIYGMAGLVFEILWQRKIYTSFGNSAIQQDTCENTLPLYVEIIPGVTSFSCVASIIGAPLMHDFAVISLSNRLTPWREIAKRLKYAAISDFVIVLMNPSSSTSSNRIEQYYNAHQILIKYRKDFVPVGIVKNASKPDESVIVCTLKDMLNFNVDMSTTIIVGKSTTTSFQDMMLTPRGYFT